jgi:carbon storage regulator
MRKHWQETKWEFCGLLEISAPVQCRSVFQTTDAKDGDAGMLILGRKLGERIRLTLNGIEIWVEVNRIAANDVRIGITAPPAVEIVREEVIGRDDPQ